MTEEKKITPEENYESLVAMYSTIRLLEEKDYMSACLSGTLVQIVRFPQLTLKDTPIEKDNQPADLSITVIKGAVTKTAQVRVDYKRKKATLIIPSGNKLTYTEAPEANKIVYEVLFRKF